MTSRTVVVGTLTVVASVLFALEIASWSSSARPSFTTALSGRCTEAISSVSRADTSAGLRQGDVIDLRGATAASRLPVVYRYAPVEAGRAGDTIQLSIQRAGRNITIPYRLIKNDSPLGFAAQLVFKLFMFVVGLFVLWRGRDRAALFLGVWCLGIMIGLPDSWWGLLPAGSRLFSSAFVTALWTYSPIMLYLIIESVAPTLLHRRTLLLSRAAMLLIVGPAVFDSSANTLAQVGSGCALIYFSQPFTFTLFLLAQGVMVAFFIAMYVKSSGVLRQRIRWIFWAFLISRFGVMLNLVNRLLVHPVHLTGAEWLTIMAFPLGCAYAILRHRIIDVNFVLNRTLIYTVLTTVAVSVFIVLEDGLNHLALGRGVSLGVELAVALGMGLSMNVLHKRVESTIERTLFRHKHSAAQALSRLSEEAAFMESPDALLARATSEIPRAVGAGGAAVYERSDKSYRCVAQSGDNQWPQDVVADDPAFVRLRTHLSEVHLSEAPSAVGSSGIAFPLAVRGQLLGALICEQRENGEAYAPDELRLLRGVAHEIGAELNAIRARQQAELLEALMSDSINLQTARARYRNMAAPIAETPGNAGTE